MCTPTDLADVTPWQAEQAVPGQARPECHPDTERHMSLSEHKAGPAVASGAACHSPLSQAEKSRNMSITPVSTSDRDIFSEPTCFPSANFHTALTLCPALCTGSATPAFHQLLAMSAAGAGPHRSQANSPTAEGKLLSDPRALPGQRRATSCHRAMSAHC